MTYYKGEKIIEFGAFFHWRVKRIYPVQALTRTEFDALETKDDNTIYEVTEED
jgi:hypothetical protein